MVCAQKHVATGIRRDALMDTCVARAEQPRSLHCAHDVSMAQLCVTTTHIYMRAPAYEGNGVQ